jgi:hypothetical protein
MLMLIDYDYTACFYFSDIFLLSLNLSLNLGTVRRAIQVFNYGQVIIAAASRPSKLISVLYWLQSY